MFESHQQLEIKILCLCLNVSIHLGESPQPLPKGDENLLLRLPYPTLHTVVGPRMGTKLWSLPQAFLPKSGPRWVGACPL